MPGLPIPLAEFKGPNSKGRGGQGGHGRGRKKERAGEGKGERGEKGAYRHFFLPTSSSDRIALCSCNDAGIDC